MRAVLGAGLVGAISACAASDVYRPASTEGVSGYRETAMENGHYLVSFTGTISMDLDEVQRLARRRAAEVTLREGYSHFVIFSARSEADIRVVPSGDYWTPDNGFRAGYLNKDSARDRMREPGETPKPWVGDSGKRTRYTAFAEIEMLGAKEVAAYPDAMAAMDVLEETAASPR